MSNEQELAEVVLTHDYWVQQAHEVVEREGDFEETALSLGVLIADLVVGGFIQIPEVRGELNGYNILAREMAKNGEVDIATRLAHRSLIEACKRTTRKRINSHRVDFNRRRNTLPHQTNKVN